MSLASGIKRAPKISILDRFFGRRAPAIAFPSGQPAGNALLNIVGVGIQFDLAGRLEGVQSFYGGGQLHAVIRGVDLTTVEFTLGVVGCQQGAPTARSWIASAGAVGVYNYMLHEPILSRHDLIRDTPGSVKRATMGHSSH